ncbi:MAG: flagellar filament capping protein FliD [Idiomarina sp.]|nr:flagellar filament capping protein FliD [Idiomarina sp.]
MGMSAIGVGSGLDLEGLVQQLVQVERAPRLQRLDTREKQADVQLSAFGRLKSTLNKINDSVSGLADPKIMSARTATVTGQNEDNPLINVTANSKAARGSYNIDVQALAQGSRLQTQANTFTSSDNEVTATGGVLTFNAGDSTFDVEVQAGATVSEVAAAVNQAAENFGVSASVVNTGGANPQTYLVFNSSVTGAGNDLTIASSAPDMDMLTTMDEVQTADDAMIIVNDIATYSATNTFENAVENLEITVNRKDLNNGPVRVDVDVDKEGVKENIEAFMAAYNGMIDEVNRLTRYNPEGDNGALIGDSLVRSIRGQLSGMLTQPVAGAADGLNTLFQLGITQDNDGKLQFDTRNLGGGTGEQRFERAINEQFDDIIALFSGENGVATRLESTLKQYTKSGGLIEGRENVAKNQKDSVSRERENFERFMEQYEQNLRRRYTALDGTIARLNQSSDFLFQRLNQM